MKFDVVHQIGAGGTGSLLYEPLCKLLAYHRNGTHNVHLWDGDSYEAGNANRQLFNREHTGKNKALAKVSEHSSSFPAAVGHPFFVDTLALRQSVENSIRLIHSALFITAVDNDASRAACIEAAEELNTTAIALILPGNGEYTGSVFTFTRYVDRNTNTKRWFPLHPYKATPQWESAVEMPTPGSCQYQSVSAPQTIVANMLSATAVLNAVRALLDGDDIPVRTDFDSKHFVMSPAGCVPRKITVD